MTQEKKLKRQILKLYRERREAENPLKIARLIEKINLKLEELSQLENGGSNND